MSYGITNRVSTLSGMERVELAKWRLSTVSLCHLHRKPGLFYYNSCRCPKRPLLTFAEINYVVERNRSIDYKKELSEAYNGIKITDIKLSREAEELLKKMT